jgi:transposase-like protein
MKNTNKSSKRRGVKCQYDPTYHPKIVKWMCRGGSTDEEIAEELGISVRQLYRWYKDYPELCQAKYDKIIADMMVEDSLYKRALGYEAEETEVIVTKDGRPLRIKKMKKHVPGNIGACMRWLCNRQPGRWRKSDS